MTPLQSRRPCRLPPTLQVFERGWVSSNNIVFTGAEDATVVDTGYVHHAAQTVALVGQALAGKAATAPARSGRAPGAGALQRIVNTHTHSDHIGGNAALRRAWPEAHIVVPAGDVDVVRRWDEAALHLSTMGQECERFAADATYDAGDTLLLGGLAWQVHAAPGHHMASLLLHCPAHALLISADALWHNGFGVIFPEIDGDPASPGEAFAAQRATLELIASLDLRTVIPGHGAPFTDVEAALERAFGRLEYFAAYPERHARNGLKVLLAFLLMIEQRIALDILPQRLAALPLAARINDLHYQKSAEELAEFVITELEKSAVAKRGDGWLLLR